MSHRITVLQLDDLDYAKNRIAQYNELPTKAQLLGFIFEVESRIEDLEYAAQKDCPTCGYNPAMEDEE